MPAMTEKTPIRVGIAGAAGRMGQRLCALAAADDALQVTVALEGPGHPAIGRPASPDLDVPVTDLFTGDADVVIDFTIPSASRSLLDVCVEHGKAMVIGTTGFTSVEAQAIAEAARAIPICKASNFSLVVNVLSKLAAQAATMLGEAYDIEIVETHHRFKKDAPSGTALSLAQAICEATGRDPRQDVRTERSGAEAPRRPGEITVQALRLGDVVGEHTVMFGTLGERLELRHIGGSRDSYATGALRAARWLVDPPKAPGLYDMADVLGL